MRVEIRSMSGKQIEAEARGHRVLVDQPANAGGLDSGMTPPELFLAALGSCAMHYAVEYLRARALPAGSLSIRVEGSKGGQPVRIDRLLLSIDAPPLERRHIEGLRRAVDACLLHRTLLHPPEIEVRLNALELEPAAV